MGIVIRPTPEVFLRSLPLVVVFGAYRRVGVDPPLSGADRDKITGVVSIARRFRAPLAFSRVVGALQEQQDGAWLPGCRPRVSDRVFDHDAGSCFANREFVRVFETILPRQIYLAGPADDSAMLATLAASSGFSRRAMTIDPDAMLQICSASGQSAATHCSTLDRRWTNPTVTLNMQRAEA